MHFRILSRKSPAPPSDNDQKLIPEVGANWYTLLVHGWVWDLIKIGYTRPLQSSDLWQLDDKRHVAVTSKKLEELFYSRCPNDVRPYHMREAQPATATTPVPDGSDDAENLQDIAVKDEKLFTDPFDPTLTYPGALLTSSARRRPSAASRQTQATFRQDKERQQALEVKTMNLRLTASSFDAGDNVHDGLSRIASRRPARVPDGGLESTDRGPPTKRRKDPRYDENLLWAMFKLIWKAIIGAGLCYGLSSGLQLGSAFVSEALLEYITDAHAWTTAPETERAGLNPTPVGRGIGLAVALAAILFVADLSEQWCMAIQREGGWILRASLWDLIAAKTFRLSPRARIAFGQGRITTAIAADCALIEYGIPWLDDLVYNFPVVVVGTGLMCHLLGPSALAGTAVLAISLPLITLLVKKGMRAREEQLAMTDKRVSRMTEAIKVVRGIKLYALESTFLGSILRERAGEIKQLKRNAAFESMNGAFLTMVPVLSTVVTFAVYSVTGHPLTPAKVFAAFQLFGIVSAKFTVLPSCLSALADAKVAVGRVQRLLTAEDARNGLIHVDRSAPDAIHINGRFTFESQEAPKESTESGKQCDTEVQKEKTAGLVDMEANEGAPFALENIDMKIATGQLVCILGRIGSGKSALASALVGAMRSTSGGVLFNGRIAYAQQIPWIQSASVRDNILFGAIQDDERLEKVLHACCLVKDIENLDDGLDTIIGENGVTLSGGQRSRLALARAVYEDADIIIMDDPLAAVDAHVARHLLRYCIHGMLADKTRILITHAIEALPSADLILCMQDGEIIQQGSFENLRTQSGVFRELLDGIGKNVEEGSANEGEDPGGSELRTRRMDLIVKRQSTDIAVAEGREEGGVRWHVYKMYGHYAGGLFRVLPILILLIAAQVSSIATTLFLGFWAEDKFSGFRVGDYIAIYSSIATSQGVILLVLSPMMAWGALRSSAKMFALAMENILRSNVQFHDQQPNGRMISRLSKDVADMDTELAWQWLYVISTALGVVGTFALVIYSLKWLGFIFLPFVGVYASIFVFYKRSSIEVKRLDNIARSFIYTAISEQLGGMACIKAHQKESIFERKLRCAIDEDNRIYHVQVVLARWLGVRTCLLGKALILAIGLFGVLYRGDISAATLGVVLVYSLNITGNFSYLLAEYVRLEQSMNYVERLLEYCDLPSEAARSCASDPDHSWPSKGAIELRDVQLRYRPELPLVLKGISCSVPPGCKLGIVGRTGAGKSSMIQALLRLVEITSGQILVDGRDLATMGLDVLRDQLSCIPQEPLLFGGTMRENLDPRKKLTDAELNDVLLKCSLIAAPGAEDHEITRLQKFKLDSEVASEGANLSIGERQLVALARAMVKGSRVIIFDEATSAMDPESDATLQQVIKRYFSHCTVLCIAHRLATIAYYDQILVLDSGEVKELAPPLDLWQKEDSMFRSMSDAAGLTREAFVHS